MSRRAVLDPGQIKVFWVPGHINVEENQLADKLARLETKIYSAEEELSTKHKIKLLKDAKDEIIRDHYVEVSSKLDDPLNSRLPLPLIEANPDNYYAIGEHLQRGGIVKDCIWKEFKVEDKTVEYILCISQGLIESRRRVLGREFFD